MCTFAKDCKCTKKLRTQVKKYVKIFRRIIFSVIIFLFFLAGMLHTSYVQTFLGNWFAQKFSAQMGIEIKIQKLKFNLFTLSVDADGLYISDHHKAPLLSVSSVQSSLGSLHFSTIHLGPTKLIDPELNIVFYKGDSLNNFQLLLQKLRPKNPDTNSVFAMQIHSVIIDNGVFAFDNRKRPEKANHTVDFDHIKITNFSFKATEISIVGDSIAANIKRIALQEQSGFELLDFASHFSICSHGMNAAKTNIATANSQINLDLEFKYRLWSDYADFNQSVHWISNISSSQLNTKDIGYFALGTQGMDNLLRFSGVTKGCVNNFSVENLLLHAGLRTLLRSDISIKNVTDIQKAIFDLDIYALQSTAQDISTFVLPKAKRISIPKYIEPLITSSLSGVFEGSFNNFTSKLTAFTNFGDMKIDLMLVDTAPESIYCKGNIKTEAFQLGEIFQIKEWIGKIDADISVDARGKRFDALNFLLNGDVKRMDFKQTELQNIHINCEARTNYFSGELDVNDEKLKFQFDGLLDFERSNPLLHYDLNIETLNFTALNIVHDSVPFILSTHIYADHTGAKLDSMFGDIYIKNTRVEKGDAVFSMAEMTISTIQLDSVNKRTQIASDCFDLELNGQYVFAKLPYIFQNTIACYIPSMGENMNLSAKHTEKGKSFPQNFKMNAQFKNTDALFGVFLPNFRMSSDAQLQFTYQSNVRESLWSVFSSSYLQYGSILYMDNITRVETLGDKLSISTFAQNLSLGDSIGLPKFYIGADFSGSDTVDWNLSWNNGKLESSRIFADIRGILDFSQVGGFLLKLKESEIFFAAEKWQVGEDAFVGLQDKDIIFHNFGIESVASKVGVFVNGELSKTHNSSLKVVFEKFDLAYFDFVFERIGMDIQALVNGQLTLSNTDKQFTFSSNLDVLNLNINRRYYGNASLFADYNKNNEGIHVIFELDNPELKIAKPSLSLQGYYYPNRTQDQLNFNAQLNTLPVDLLSNYLKSFASDLTGAVSGHAKLSGTLKNPYFSGNLTGKDIALKVNILNTYYIFNDFVCDLTSSALVFKECSFKDSIYQSSGVLKGEIKHKNFKDIALGLDIVAQKLLVLNTTASKEELYYGRIFVSGLASIHGSTDDITINVNAKSEKNSSINFNLASQSNTSGSNFIRFYSPQADSIAKLQAAYMQTKPTKIVNTSSKFRLILNLETNPDVAVGVDIKNASMSGQLSVKGEGPLRFEFEMPGQSTSLFGTYTVQSGIFDFSMQNLLNKQFIIQDGGTIAWTGDITGATLNINAIYPTRTSLYPVLASVSSILNSDEDANVRRKVNVESIIEMTGQLMNPQIKFDINLLNVDQETKNLFFSLVNKDNESEMLKQTFSLLMFNSFIATGDNALMPSLANTALASSSEIIFSQFNNVLSKLSKDFDVGVNFRPEDNTSTSEFQVMMSGQLFDDRLTIDGNIGVGGSAKDMAPDPKNASNIVGDINVEWKFTDKLRLRAFNRSNERDLMRPESSYTQGLGIVYSRDFDYIGELFRKRKTPKK